MSFLPGLTKPFRKIGKALKNTLPTIAPSVLAAATGNLAAASVAVQTAKSLYNASATKSAGNFDKRAAREIYIHRLSVLARQENIQARQQYLLDEDYNNYKQRYKPFEKLYLAQVGRLFRKPLKVEYSKAAKKVTMLTLSGFNNLEHSKHRNELVKVYDNYQDYMEYKMRFNLCSKALAQTSGVAGGFLYENHRKELSDLSDLSLLSQVVSLGNHIKSGVAISLNNQANHFNADPMEMLHRIGNVNEGMKAIKSSDTLANVGNLLNAVTSVKGSSIGSGLQQILGGLL